MSSPRPRPRLPSLVYQLHLQGHSPEAIKNKLTVYHNLFLDVAEINDIIHAMKKLYF